MRRLNTQPCAKWELSTNPVNFIGHVISSRGIKADPKKLQVITDLPPPQNVQKRVLLEASIVRVRSDDTHRNQNRAGREGSSSSVMGVRAIMGIHRGEVNHYGNGPQTAGTTAEYSHTGSTSSTNSEIQNTTNKNIHSGCDLGKGLSCLNKGVYSLIQESKFDINWSSRQSMMTY